MSEKFRSVAAIGLTCIVLALASACASGPNGTQALPQLYSPQNAAATAGKLQKVSFVFDARVPKRRDQTPNFLSAATKSIRLTIAQGKKKIASATMTLTLGSKNCAATLQATVCTIAFDVAAGKGYVAAITAYDQAKGKGAVLSTGQSIAFNVAGATTVPLTLDGVPKAILAKQIDTGTILVTAVDADGNIIVGPGAPSFKASLTSGTAVAAITQPTASTPNTIRIALAVPSPSPPATETIGVTATYPKGSGKPCSQAGAVCSRTIATASYKRIAAYFTADYDDGALYGYSVPFTGLGQLPTYTIFAPAAWEITSDAHGILYAADYDSGTFYTISPPYTGSVVSDSGAATDSYAMAVNSAGVAVVAATSGNEVDEFNPPYTASATPITSGVNGPGGVAFDASDNLYVPNDGNYTMGVYAAGAYTTQKYSVTLGAAPYSATAIGSKLYVGETNAVEIFTLPITSSAATPVATITSGVDEPYSTALDAAGDLWVSDYGSGKITEYAAPVHTGEAPSVTLSTGLSSPSSLAFDDAGNLYVTDDSNETVVMFSPPFANGSAPAGTSNTLKDIFFGTLVVTPNATFTLSVP